jgi:uncharacterized protein (TIGR02594 family)
MHRRLLGCGLLLCSFAVAAPTASATAAPRHHHHHAEGHKVHAAKSTRHARLGRHKTRAVRSRAGERSLAQVKAETAQPYGPLQPDAESRFGLPVQRASKDRTARRAVSSASDVVAEARRWVGRNPTGRSSLWCARFMNFVLKHTGREGTGSDLARSFAHYGHRVPGPRVGAIAVMSRGRRGGHVGVVSGIDENGNPIVISGNHNRRVEEAVYPRGRVYAYVMPTS